MLKIAVTVQIARGVEERWVLLIGVKKEVPQSFDELVRHCGEWSELLN